MGDKKKTLIITLSSALGGTAIIAGTTIGVVVSQNNKRKEQVKTVDTIKIVSEIPSFELEEGKSVTSEPIEVKCYTADQEEIESVTKLNLYNQDHKTNEVDWIYLNESNQIVITESAPKGEYLFYLQATTEVGNEIKFSEEKEINVVVKEKEPEPEPTVIDKVTIEGFSEHYMYYNTVKQFHLKCIAWSGDKEVRFPAGTKLSWNFIMSGPICSWIVSGENNQEATLSVTSDDTYGKIGSYNLRILLKMQDDTTLMNESFDFKVIDGYSRTIYNNVYTRSSLEGSWTLKEQEYRCATVCQVMETIDGFPVTTVADNFAENSSITYLVTSVELPFTITTIGENAFKNCAALENVTMPGVTTIGANAFNGCGLMTLSGSEPKLIEVGENAFYSCENFKIKDLSGLKTIAAQSFYNTGIEEIYLSSELTKILTNAFVNCSKLNTVTITAQIPPTMEGLAFYNCQVLQSIFVPADSYSLYCGFDNWRTYESLIKKL